jgi:hypothetical protein
MYLTTATHQLMTGVLMEKCNIRQFFKNFYSFIHVCIHCLGHFSPMPPTTSPLGNFDQKT